MRNFFIGMEGSGSHSLDQRKQPRVAFSGKGSVVFGPRPIEITISNISLSGLLFHAKERFDLGKLLTLRIVGEEEGKPFEEQVAGRVVAVHRGNERHSYGLQYLALLTAEKQPCLFAKIQRFLQKQS